LIEVRPWDAWYLLVLGEWADLSSLSSFVQVVMQVLMQVLSGFLILLILGSICFYFAGALLTWQFFQARPARSTSSRELPVSILVPIKGIDPDAWHNWSAFLAQDYPDYQVWFGVMDADDPAIPIVESIVANHPDRAHLLVGLPPRGPNHKDSNLSYLLEQTNTEWIVFADSDIGVTPDYLSIVTGPLQDDRVGMVTCSYLARRPQFMGAALASLARCCDFMPSLLIARAIDGGLKLGIGVTMAVRRQALVEAGGIVFNRIGSDYNLGSRIRRAGYRVELSDYVLESDTGKESIGTVIRRELRWARTIRFNRGPTYYGQIFCFGLVYCLPLLVLTGFSGEAIGLTGVTLLIRYVQATIATVYLDAPQLRRWFWLLPLRDVMSFGIWVVGGYGRTIDWRGRRLKVQGDGVITED
jgi:ceramide glucosyltransferase